MTYRRVADPSEVVVIFKTHLRDGAGEVAYEKASKRMHDLVETIPGFISIKGFRSADGGRWTSSASRTRRPSRRGGPCRNIVRRRSEEKGVLRPLLGRSLPGLPGI